MPWVTTPMCHETPCSTKAKRTSHSVWLYADGLTRRVVPSASSLVRLCSMKGVDALLRGLVQVSKLHIPFFCPLNLLSTCVFLRVGASCCACGTTNILLPALQAPNFSRARNSIDKKELRGRRQQGIAHVSVHVTCVFYYELQCWGAESYPSVTDLQEMIIALYRLLNIAVGPICPFGSGCTFFVPIGHNVFNWERDLCTCAMKLQILIAA